MSRRTVHFIHGIATQGDGRVARLAPYFEQAGYHVLVHSYPWTWVFTVRSRNVAIAADLADKLQDGDIIVGHSNGCVIAHRAAARSKHVNLGLIHINPALPSWADPPPGVQWVHVYYAPSDEAVVYARWARRTVNGVGWLVKKLSPFSWFKETLWGAMGRIGYKGDSPIVEQTNLDELFGEPVDHSGALKNRHRWRIGCDAVKVAERHAPPNLKEG